VSLGGSYLPAIQKEEKCKIEGMPKIARLE